jgi:hypothetical protein
MMRFLTANKKLILSILLNIVLLFTLLALLYLVYPELIYHLDSVSNLWDRYSIRTYRKNEARAAYFEVMTRYRRLYSFSGEQRFFVEYLGGHLTGNGEPDIVIRQWEGGAHGDSKYIVLELDGSTAKRIDVIDGLLDAGFKDLNGDGVDEITGMDGSYNNFLGESTAASPRPLVILSFDRGQDRFVPNREMMVKAPLSREQFNEMSQRYRGDKAWHERSRPPADLLETMLQLIYSANEKQAWELFDASWPDPSPVSKEQYREDIRAELSRALTHSPFYRTIDHWNKERQRAFKGLPSN